MATERELANARRDYDRQIREATHGWWRTLWLAARDLFRAFAGDVADRPSTRRQRHDRKAEVERAAKERL